MSKDYRVVLEIVETVRREVVVTISAPRAPLAIMQASRDYEDDAIDLDAHQAAYDVEERYLVSARISQND